MNKDLGKGDKSSVSGNPIDMGLSERSGFSHDGKLRGETSEKEQRPKAKTETVSSDRGSFKNRC